MRKKLSLALAAILTVSTMILPAGAAGPRFTDVPEGHWAYESIEYAVDHGYFSGTGEDTFSPDGTMTRAMLWTVLASMAGESTAAQPGQPWYQGGQDWAVENGISDGSNPNGNITREQFATMLYNFAELTGAPTDKNSSVLNTFSDRNTISTYAVDAMAWAVTHSIISGTSGTTISPAGLATRAQAAVMLMQFDKMGEGETTDPDEPDQPVTPDYETVFHVIDAPPTYPGDTIEVGRLAYIAIGTKPARANIEAGVTYTVTCSDPSMVSINLNEAVSQNEVCYDVKGLKAGTATITAVGSDGFRGTVTITIEDPEGETPTPETPDVDWGQYAEMKQEIVELINKERNRIGLNTLEVSAGVMKAAQVRSDECATWKFSHTRPDGSSYNTVYKEVGLSTGGNEILASGTVFNSAETIVDAWIDSSGHYASMTDSRFNYIGVGISSGKNGALLFSVELCIDGD